MAEAGKELQGLGLPDGDATQWPLQRYGRFMPSITGEPPESGLEAGTASSLTWKVRLQGRKHLEVLTRVRREGRRLQASTLAVVPEGHTGGGDRGWQEWLAHT